MRDIDVRRALCSKLRHDHAGEENCVWVEELELCQGAARVDMAVVNGTIHGYEIKSERDTLTRLPSQQRTYNDALEFVTIVAAPNHLKKIVESVPEWWGVWSANPHNGEIQLSQERTAKRNPQLMSYALAQYLWREEALRALEWKGEARGIRGKPRRFLWQKLTEVYCQQELTEIVRCAIKARSDCWRAVPPST
ncbi:MAG TPA: sce7726 family protein [Acidobacteriaceae bacterium]|jgi:hypothetical protein